MKVCLKQTVESRNITMSIIKVKTEICIQLLKYSQHLYILCWLDIVSMSEFFHFHLDVCQHVNNVYYEVLIEACLPLEVKWRTGEMLGLVKSHHLLLQTTTICPLINEHWRVPFLFEHSPLPKYHHVIAETWGRGNENS